MEDLMTHYLEHTPSNGRMIDELWTRQDLEGIGHGLIKVLIDLAFAWRERGKPWKISVGIAGAPAEIQTEHLPNESRRFCKNWPSHPIPSPILYQ
jgi:hypothetical protein